MTPDRLKRLEEIEARLKYHEENPVEREDFESLVECQMPWLITELRAAWDKLKIAEEEFENIERTSDDWHECIAFEIARDALSKIREGGE